MKIKQFLSLIYIISITTIHGSNQSRELTFTESILLGGTVGAAEVAFPGQPLSYAMNQKIKGQPCNWRHAYKGLFANAIGQMPITALQKAVQTEGTKYIQSSQTEPLSIQQKAIISYLAGIAGALVDTPSNAIQLYQQDRNNTSKSIWQAMQALGRNNYRGFWANALIKEGPFTVGYQVLAGKGKATAQKYTENETTASIAGGTGAGAITAAITQPGAVIRNKIQTGESNVIENIIKKEGLKGFYKGLAARGGRVMCAIPLYATYSSYLEKKIKNKQ